jgi:hypothetical protein
VISIQRFDEEATTRMAIVPSSATQFGFLLFPVVRCSHDSKPGWAVKKEIPHTPKMKDFLPICCLLPSREWEKKPL